MKTKTILCAVATGCQLLGLAPGAHAQANVFTYQGRVQSGGTAFTGVGQFKFALVTVTNTAATATATATTSGGFVTIITVTSGGSGYVAPPAVIIYGGGGSGATATAFLNGNAVSSITVNNPGNGYVGTPTVSVAPPPANIVYTSFWSNDGKSNAGSEPIDMVHVPVSNGLFVVRLGDPALVNMTALPAGIFQQPDLHLRVWFNDGINGFAVLHPTQALTATPYAFVAGSASNLLGTVGAAGLSGTYSDMVKFNNQGNSFSGEGTALTKLNASQLTAGTVPVTALGNAWKTGGNAGAAPPAHFIGTTDNQPLEFKVNGTRALRLEDNGDGRDPDSTPDGAPNVVAGSPRNFVASGVVGATIGGGGATNDSGYRHHTNSVHADYGTLGGGLLNTIAANSRAAVIAGGHGNDIGTNAPYSFIGGGWENGIWHHSTNATISGGVFNFIGTNSSYSVIAGGYDNDIQENAPYSFIAGGWLNEVTASFGFAAGRAASVNHRGAFVWSDASGPATGSSAANSVTMRGAGGYRLLSSSNTLAGVRLAPEGTAWGVLSDRNAKKDFRPVNARELLEKLASLSIPRWNYQWEAPGSPTHIGPTAQDFKAAFYPGSDDKVITTQEADGVALAAIQGLNQKLEAELHNRNSEIAELKSRLAKLERLLLETAIRRE